MFRVVPQSIIRSTNNCIYSIWYSSHHYCYLPLLWKSSNSSTIVAGSSNGVTNTRCCTYSCLCSWWWVEVPPAICRAVSRQNKLCYFAFCWIYIRILLRCTDPWTLNLFWHSTRIPVSFLISCCIPSKLFFFICWCCITSVSSVPRYLQCFPSHSSYISLLMSSIEFWKWTNLPFLNTTCYIWLHETVTYLYPLEVSNLNYSTALTWCLWIRASQ
jgi:hypothetical protein